MSQTGVEMMTMLALVTVEAYLSVRGIDSIMKRSNNCVATTDPGEQQPNTVAVDTASGRVFVTGREGDQLQILDPQ